MKQAYHVLMFSLLQIAATAESLPLTAFPSEIEQFDLNFGQDIQALLNKGAPVEQLISINTLHSIDAEPVDYRHVKTSCTVLFEPTSKNGLRNQRRRWYKNKDGEYVVPCVVSRQYTEHERDLLYAAMIEIQETTCIRFYIYQSSKDLQGWDFVEVTRNAKGCFSQGIGRLRRGRQQMNLQPTDSQGLSCMIKGIAVHELLHVIGFHHQQNAPERDDYVTILWNNIVNNNGARYQFNKLTNDAASSFDAPYDYNSIMHYAKKDFSRNGEDTIEAKETNATFGQRERISEWDAFKDVIFCSAE